MSSRNQSAMGAFSTEVSRTYQAAPEKVFRAWTDPDSVRAWLAGGKRAFVDARVDGLFYIEMPWEARIYPHYGRYLRVESPRVIEFTWVSEGTNGKESVVTIELKPEGSGTALRLLHEGIPTQESADSHNGGWADFLQQLDARV